MATQIAAKWILQMAKSFYSISQMSATAKIRKDLDLSIHYQVFIEPKGEHLLKYDEWKENFLKSLKKKHQINVLWKSKKYTVWGMPFYNEALKKTEFDNEFRASLL